MSGLTLGGKCITAVHQLTWRGSSLHILMEPSPAPAQRRGDLLRSHLRQVHAGMRHVSRQLSCTVST